MIRLRPRHWLPLLRVLVLGLFAVGLVLQPVMAAVGEMHELTHDPSGSHIHDQHADDLGAGDEHDEDGASTLHVLLHFAHCCGATAAMVQLLGPVPSMPADASLATAMTPMAPQPRLSSPFKPPIFA